MNLIPEEKAKKEEAYRLEIERQELGRALTEPKMIRALALYIAEHEVMSQRLVELEEIIPEKYLRWRATGEPIVNLKEAVLKFTEKMKDQGL